MPPITISANDQNYTTPNNPEVIREATHNILPRNEEYEIIISDGITAIYANAFANCEGLTSVTIPPSVQKIGKKAFSGCVNLKTVNFMSRPQNRLPEIGAGAFSGCLLLHNITDNGTLYHFNCAEYTNDEEHNSVIVNIQDGVNKIAAGAFENEQWINCVVFPKTVASIEEEAFSGCVNLTQVIFHGITPKIGTSAFKNCINLHPIVKETDNKNRILLFAPVNNGTIEVPNDVSEIESEAFKNNLELERLMLPENVLKIGSSAFSDCTNLESVTILGRVTEIRYKTFFGCTNLSTVSIPSSVTAIWNSAFEKCPLKFERNVFNNVTEIGYHAIPRRILRNGQINYYNPQYSNRLFEKKERFEYECQSITRLIGSREDDKTNIISPFVSPTIEQTEAERESSAVDNWMNIPYVWPQNKDGTRREDSKNEEETIYEFYGYSRWLNHALLNKDKSSCKDCIACILKWGGVKQHEDKHVHDFYEALLRIRKDNIISFDEIMRQGRKGNNHEEEDRSSTWTKILAAYQPGKLFIYDSRVALALSFISLKLNAPCFWMIPKSRNNNEQENNLTNREFVTWPESVHNKIETNRNKTHCKEENIPTCYNRYLNLLYQLACDNKIVAAYNQLPENIRGAYEKVFAFIPKKERAQSAIMAHLEKVLFMMKGIILR